MVQILRLLFFTLFLSLGSAFVYGFQSGNNKISVMTFNIRYDNAKDAPNHWENRRDWVGDLISFYNPDFVGTQEVLHNQLLDMQERLPGYRYFGQARDDGKQKGEYSAVFFNKDKYEVLSSATFWLSETPEEVGKIGWDAACNRVVTWGKFRNIQTKKVLFVFNTHFDHLGKTARSESSKLLLKKVQEIAGNEEAIITGDFNATPESDVYQMLTSSSPEVNQFFDSFSLSTKPYGPVWTFHGFGKTPMERRSRIDYIFTNKKVIVEKYFSIAEQRGEIFPSDHLPVFVELFFE